jgi:hypothetical protein
MKETIKQYFAIFYFQAMHNSKQSQVQRFLTDSQAVVCFFNVFKLNRDVFRTETACDVRCMKNETDFAPGFFTCISEVRVCQITGLCGVFFGFFPCCTLRYPLKDEVPFVFTPI